MSDYNYESHADETGLRLTGRTIAPIMAYKYDDVLKLSNCSAVFVEECVINPDGGNREDGVDLMRGCDTVTFRRCEVGAGERYAFTIKGGCENILLDDVVIVRPGGGWERVDIDLGNFSHTCPHAKTGLVILKNVRRADGRPVRLRVGFATTPHVMGGNVKVLFWQSLMLKAYVALRRFFRR